MEPSYWDDDIRTAENLDLDNLIDYFTNDNLGTAENLVGNSLGTVTGNIPSRDDYPGDFNFSLCFDSTTTGQQWVYSDVLNQLFIGMNKTLVIHFKMCNAIIAKKLYIRAMPVYSTDDYVNIPVNRCVYHSVEDDPQGQAHQQIGQCLCGTHNNFVGHVIRVEGNDADYLYDTRTERHSVRVSICGPQPGSFNIPIPFSFACKTSCPKGMQRRPIHVIFTLEDESGLVLGRRKLGVKICSCPKRDKKRQEDDYYINERGGVERKRKRPLTKEETQPDQWSNINNVKVETNPYEGDDLVTQIKRHMSEMKDHFKIMTQKMELVQDLVQRLDKNH